MSGKSIFISYSHDRANEVERLVTFLELSSINVYYSKEILSVHGEWGRQLEDFIDCSDAILLLYDESLSKKKHGHVFVEILYAQNKDIPLIPVLIGEAIPDIDYFGLIARRHIHRVPSIDDLQSHEGFLRELSALGTLEANPEAHKANGKAGAWMQRGVTARQLSLALSLAFLQYEPPEQVFNAATILERLLVPQSDNSANKPSEVFGTASRTARLDGIQGLVAYVSSSDSGLEVPIVRFKQDDWARDLLSHVWIEEPDVREKIMQWAVDLCLADPNGDIIRRIGVSIGLLAENNFYEIVNGVIFNWLKRPEPQLRRVADLALAVAAENSNNRSLIEGVVENLIELRSTVFLCAALELSCGYTGMRLPNLAVSTLRRIGRKIIVNERMRSIVMNSPLLGPGDVDLSYIDKEVQPDTDVHMGIEPSDIASDENATSPATIEVDVDARENVITRTPHLLKVATFLGEISEWASQRAKTQDQALQRQLPLFILLAAFQKVRFLRSESSDLLTLEDLIDVSFIPKEVLDRILSGLTEAALAKKRIEYSPRMHLKNVVQRFSMIRKSTSTLPDPDPFLVFLSAVHEKIEREAPGQAYPVVAWTGAFTSEKDKNMIRRGGHFRRFSSETDG
ncbi:MAG: toll/interleukin-1 receptor domain-containing protein [Pseudomonadota bacterium]